MSDDESINPHHGQGGERNPLFSDDTVSLHPDFGPSGPTTSVDSDMIGPASKYLPGDIIDGAYKLAALLGRGGMGVVFACHHLTLGKDYAIKLLSDQSLNSVHWSRFQTEAKALAKLNHPGIVKIYNMGIDKGQCPYYVMELLSGEGLEALIKRSGPMPINKALECFIQVADALYNAHTQGIIHRDIKPSNIMLVGHSKDHPAAVKIVDFGIARLSKQGLGSQTQTATGLIVGTPFYMSPEQCQGLRVDERSDIYSFGCALFEALTGSPPFRGENAFQTFLMHQSETPPRLADAASGAHFPQSLELAVDKMLRKAPADRYQKMDQVMHDLERVKAGKEILMPGLNTTISPVQRANNVGTADRPGENKTGTSSRSLTFKMAVFLAVPILLLAGALFVFHKAQPNAEVEKPASGSLETTADTPREDSTVFDPVLLTPRIELKRAGCTDEEIKCLKQYDFIEADQEQKIVKKKFALYLPQALENGSHFLNNSRTAFDFPSEIVIGAISFGEDKPILATGSIPVPKDKSVCFYQNVCLEGLPKFVNLFGPDDLTGIELVLKNPDRAISKIRHWKRLKLLSFFNSIAKAMPGFDYYDQSHLTDAQLPSLEHFPQLETLGLCGKEVTGAKVAEMPLIRKLTSLRLKQIRDIDAVLKVLPELDNLKEVWLGSEDLTDEQLDYLSKMKNLESLRIRRSLLTPKSVVAFKQMHSLRRLYLDRNWTATEKEQFKSAIPFCQFESVLDDTYWKALSQQ